MTPLTIATPDGDTVSALLSMPEQATAMFVFAHGAGAGMAHAFMHRFAEGLADRRVASLRYQFPSMERGSGRPDRPPVAHATVRAAVAVAAMHGDGLPLFAGGKSFGGRMTSQAQALAPLAGVRGLVFVGFPLHPAGKPSVQRADHLQGVACPMLFLQGSRDALADPTLLSPTVTGLGDRATLLLQPDADHGFHVRKSSGRTDDQVIDAMLDATVDWMSA